MINEPMAQLALHEANRHVAAIFRKQPEPVRFVFLSYIANPSRRAGQVAGLCVRKNLGAEIQLVAGEGWQRVAIHELIHLYNSEAREPKVERLTEEVVKYLKLKFGGG